MKVLIVVDSPGWAYDHKADSIIRHLEGFDYNKIYFSDFRWSAALDFDVVFFMGFFYFPPHEIPNLFKDKVVSTLTSFAFTRDSARLRMLPAACQNYAKTGAVSRDLHSVLASNGAVDPVLCLNGVEEDIFVPGEGELGSDTLRIGWVGSSRGEVESFDFKGLDTIAKPLFKKLSSYSKDFSIKPILVNSFDQDKLRSQSQMVEYYQGIDLFISTSHRFSEGTPNPAFEAASCGIPVISTENGSIKDLVKNGINGYTVPGWTTEKEAEISLDKIKEYILKLEADRPLLRELGENSRKEVLANWRWADRARAYSELFLVNG